MMEENMLQHMDNIALNPNIAKDEGEPEAAVYTMLKFDDQDEYDDAPSTSTASLTFDDVSNDGDDLLEPFPERSIDHDRRPSGADIDAKEDDKDLRPGDHIYVWKSFGVLGMRTYQKHGIVLSIDPDDDSNVTIVTFYHQNKRDPGVCDEFNDDNNDESLLNSGSDGNVAPSNGNKGREKNQERTATVQTESLLTFALNSKGKVFKVKYDQGLAKRLLSRGGTVTSCQADEDPLILARVKYLLETGGRMPEYQMMSANGECAAVWCCIGRWCTLQGSSILHILFAGQAGGAVTGGLVASNVMFWSPMPGVWGSIGYVWYVPATVAFPLLTPLLIGFGLASLVPLEVLRRYRKKWAETSKEMNTNFWSKTSADVRDFYYASTISADENWMNSFFGEKKEEIDKGDYMPLDASGDGIGVEEDEDEDEMTKRISAEYGMNINLLQKHELENNSTSKETWQDKLGKIKRSFITQHESNVKPIVEDEERDVTKPLNYGTSKDIL